MNHAAKLTRDDTITEALRAVNDAIGDDEPHEQAFRIIAALKALRDDRTRVAGGGVDYLRKVQDAAQRAWIAGSGDPTTAGLATPIGVLSCTTWQRKWSGSRGERAAWASEYTLDGEPITVSEIKAAGLAQRPTTRNRQKKEPRK